MNDNKNENNIINNENKIFINNFFNFNYKKIKNKFLFFFIIKILNCI